MEEAVVDARIGVAKGVARRLSHSDADELAFPDILGVVTFDGINVGGIEQNWLRTRRCRVNINSESAEQITNQL